MKKVLCVVMVFMLTLSASIFPVLGAGEIKILLDEKYLEMDVRPVIVNSRTLVPARAVVEKLGGKVEWNGEKRLVTVTKEDITILITVNDTTALVNGTKHSLDVPAQIVDSRTMIPLRFVAEALGVKVDFYNNTVIILSDLNANSLISMDIIDGKNLVQPSNSQLGSETLSGEGYVMGVAVGWTLKSSSSGAVRAVAPNGLSSIMVSENLLDADITIEAMMEKRKGDFKTNLGIDAVAEVIDFNGYTATRFNYVASQKPAVAYSIIQNGVEYYISLYYIEEVDNADVEAMLASFKINK